MTPGLTIHQVTIGAADLEPVDGPRVWLRKCDLTAMLREVTDPNTCRALATRRGVSLGEDQITDLLRRMGGAS